MFDGKIKRIFNKLLVLFLAFIAISFFSNDFGLIDIEKTAIITALAIDYDENEYEVTAQVAVPEATDTNTENLKAELTGKGYTIGAAIKNVGNVSGWFPKLAFCNLIILGEGFNGTNVIRVLDYFAKTLRIQDSAVVVMAETSAKELLESTTPLDNISAFALQKVLLKDPGFDRDIKTVDIRTFTAGYYSHNSTSFMPIVKTVDRASSDSEGGGQGGQKDSSSKDSESKPVLYDATTTALFLGGVKTAELDKMQTFAFNLLSEEVSGSTFEIENLNGKNYLLTFYKISPNISLSVDITKIKADISVDIYCKITDHNGTESYYTYADNVPLPLSVKERAENEIKNLIEELIEIEKESKTDFLKLKDRLYKYHYGFYPVYKDEIFDKIETDVRVSVIGQK